MTKIIICIITEKFCKANNLWTLKVWMKDGLFYVYVYKRRSQLKPPLATCAIVLLGYVPNSNICLTLQLLHSQKGSDQIGSENHRQMKRANFFFLRKYLVDDDDFDTLSESQRVMCRIVAHVNSRVNLFFLCCFY